MFKDNLSYPPLLYGQKYSKGVKSELGTHRQLKEDEMPDGENAGNKMSATAEANQEILNSLFLGASWQKEPEEAQTQNQHKSLSKYIQSLYGQ